MTMTRIQITLFVSIFLTSLLLAPAPAAAQPRPTAAQVDALAPQEKEMLAAAQDFARRVTESMEGWLATKEVSEERLFACMYYPTAKTDPPKFTTDWDRLSDRDIQGIEEAIMTRSQTLVFAVLVDKHGYLPTHNLRYSQPLTGNLANDLVNNRTKRIFNDKTGLAAARSVAPFLIQRYQRDTGETMVDLSVPVFLRGMHWGAVRLGFRAVEAR
jgi:methyl-accepting chemotaxis protein